MADSKIKPCAWVTKADVRDFYTGPGESVFLFERSGKWNFPLIPLSEAQRLEAEVQRLREDAERYRWLRDKAVNFVSDDDGPAPWAVIGTRWEDSAPCRGADLDAAIDAAIKGEKE